MFNEYCLPWVCYLHTSSDWRSWKSVHFQAGIKSSNLIIANESNAASVFCLFDRSERGNIRGLDTQPVGTKYMVVDIGGVNFSLTDDQIKINTCKFGKSHFPKARGVTVIILEDVIIIWGHVSHNPLKTRTCWLLRFISTARMQTNRSMHFWCLSYGKISWQNKIYNELISWTTNYWDIFNNKMLLWWFIRSMRVACTTEEHIILKGSMKSP